MSSDREVAGRPLTLAGIVRNSMAAAPDRKALALDLDARTFRQLWEKGEVRARQMVALGVGAGDRVGVLLPNRLDYYDIVLGAAMIGAIAVPMNVRYKSRELEHLITDSGMKAIFTQSVVEDVVDFGALLAETLPGLSDAKNPTNLSLEIAPALRAIVALDAACALFTPDASLTPFTGALPPEPRPEDALLLMYTSGTTANPKGCIVSHRAIVSNAWAIVDMFDITPDDLWWCPLPMFHIGGQLFAMAMVAGGAGYAGMAHFDADRALDMIEQDPPTIFYPLFPTITLPIVDHPRFAGLDHGKMRFMFNLAPSDLQRKIQATVPHAPLMGAFGMTETCGTVCYGSPDDSAEIRYATCGKPLPGWSVRTVDLETREDVPIGEKGEIAVRGIGLFGGYWNAPELTARQHLPGGWFLTGDVGSLDAEGRLSFHGRFKDQLKVGGENVSALEVESFLSTHPAVSLAQVVGIADEKYGELPAAFIELKVGQQANGEELIAFCQGKIARFKIPRHIRFVTEWPMSATKILKYKLKNELEAELAGREPAASHA